MKSGTATQLRLAERMPATAIALAIAWGALGVVTAIPAHADDATAESFFENRIRPVLAGVCVRCHGPQKQSGGLRLDSRDALIKGGESGPAISTGDLEQSLLLRAVRREKDVSAMPPDRALPRDQVADVAAWIKAGAPWPKRSERIAAAKHWAFQPICDVKPPDVREEGWVRSSIDRFILARLEGAGGKPAPEADRRTLLRRVSYDLLGLPPTADDVTAFEQDSSPAAFEKIVDRLLESPHYGQRWGRHWLDLVRYADTAGETADYPVPTAWRYRNYVIDSFNADKPYDEFVREQIAGDILASAGPRERYAERATGTGFLAISRRFGFDSENYHHLTIQDTIDTLGQTVLGLSLGCARCHDHKFDPISMRDYYALYGIFDSSRYAFPGSEQKQQVRAMLPLVPPDESVRRWHSFDARVASIALALERDHQPIPKAVLRSLHDIDGDFELQAPAAGGSNGVLVPPWLYQGKIAVTLAAQSPFTNVHARGKVGVSVAEDAGLYRIAQAIYPPRTPENCGFLHMSIDFRVGRREAGTSAIHRFSIGAGGRSPAALVLISADGISLAGDKGSERIAGLQAGQWHHLQLALDLRSRVFSGRVETPDHATEFSGKPFVPGWPGRIDMVVLDAVAERGTGGGAKVKVRSIEFDNLAVREAPIPRVSQASAATAEVAGAGAVPDGAGLAAQLRELAGFDGDFEMQEKNGPPAYPWNAGPNSVVMISAEAQSPYRNFFAAGELGIHMPNRREYDGFGRWLPTVWRADKSARLFASFDFRCATKNAGGDGSWRDYLGHGPGQSAAVELFWNGNEFFRRSGDATERVSELAIGEWYQVQLALELKTRTYRGVIASPRGQTPFDGRMASGWDGTIDHAFIDSFGHRSGVRPALDADNFLIGEAALRPLEKSPAVVITDEEKVRRRKVAAIRQQLAGTEAGTLAMRAALSKALEDGPFAMTYGVVEGTPHDVPMQMRGEPDRPGEVVPRGFIKILGGGPLPEQTTGSGRLELAEWLTRGDNPLAARVMVNRIWQHHFGHALVRTPNDFGARGQKPSHPELLDYLAKEFIRSGWSIKSMHRLLILSSTYRQSSTTGINQRVAAAEPTGGDFSPFLRRRLDAQELRDSILAKSGELEETVARGHPFPSPLGWAFTQHSPFIGVYDQNKRSVYLMTQRIKRHPFLALFDGADPNATTPERATTTVPTQALFFLNDPFVHAKAEKCAAGILAERPEEMGRIELAWRRVLERDPTGREREEARRFLDEYRSELAASGNEQIELGALAAYVRVLFGSNEFIYLD